MRIAKRLHLIHFYLKFYDFKQKKIGLRTYVFLNLLCISLVESLYLKVSFKNLANRNPPYNNCLSIVSLNLY